MQIDTPHFQGSCATHGSKGWLPQISIDKFSSNGNLSVIALDETIADASRLLVVCATNALNNNMVVANEFIFTVDTAKLPDGPTVCCEVSTK